MNRANTGIGFGQADEPAQGGKSESDTGKGRERGAAAKCEINASRVSAALRAAADSEPALSSSTRRSIPPASRTASLLAAEFCDRLRMAPTTCGAQGQKVDTQTAGYGNQQARVSGKWLWIVTFGNAFQVDLECSSSTRRRTPPESRMASWRTEGRARALSEGSGKC